MNRTINWFVLDGAAIGIGAAILCRQFDIDFLTGLSAGVFFSAVWMFVMDLDADP